jgi:hypothetical protein
MRVALNAVTAVGTRAGKILLAEKGLDALGLYGNENEGRGADRKVMVIRDVAGFDILVSDDTAITSALAGIAADDGLSFVTTDDRIDEDLPDRFAAAGTTLLLGANLATGLAPALASHESTRVDTVLRTTVAWTVPGTPRRRGVVVPFPEPIGPRWAASRRRQRRASHRRYEVPIRGDWAGATVIVDGIDGGREVERVIGVADHREHLDAICLAAAALAVAEGSFGAGLHRPADRPGDYLSAALRVGLGVASYTE